MNALKNTRALGKLLFDRIRNEKIQNNFLQALPFWIASLASGLIAVLYAWLFAKAEELSREILRINLWWILLLTPTCFVAAYYIVERFSKYARGSGIPQVMAALELPGTSSDKKLLKLVGIRVMITKIASSLLMVLGGGVMGREGPTIQLASSVFKKINQWVPESWPKISKRTMIMTGAAAGLAAAFNTPLGGIVFAVEELTRTHIRYYRTAIFSAVIISGLTAQWLLGPYLYLGYPDVRNLSTYVFGGVLIVAVLTGLGGSIMSVIMLRLFSWKRTFNNKQQYLYVLCCALIISLVALYDTHILSSGKQLMNDLLFHADKHQVWYVPILRVAGQIMSFTTGAAGGVFSPALSSGASIGGVIAQAFHLSATNSNLLILAGMVGFLTGLTRTPFTSAILVLEMTDRHSVIFYLMFAGMVASIVSIFIDKHSFYDHLKHSYIHDIQAEDTEEPATNLDIAKATTSTTT
jgi:H+/Cl- antiporter ClcA